MSKWVVAHLSQRARKERDEFEAVCRKHGRKLPPDHEIAAGRDWTDPYDEDRRELPADIRAERALMRGVIAALEAARSDAHYAALVRIFGEHHDPEVLGRVVECFAKWKEWRALPLMADFVRIQQWGRGVGGSDVIGRKQWNEMRLKWDVHKDRLWWSRPEYAPRLIKPICAAASATTGAEVTSVVMDLDSRILIDIPAGLAA